MTSDELISDYERDGCLRVRKFFDAKTLADVRAALARYERDVMPTIPESDRTFEVDGKAVRNLWRIEQHDSFFKDLALRPEILQLVSALVHGEPELMGVETFNKPARVGSGVPPHQDNAYFCRTPADVLTIWVALDAATEANGPIFYLKGSQSGGIQPHRPSGVAGNSMGLAKMPPHEESDVFRGTLEPGDALIHHCETIHWSAPNKTDSPRCGFLMVFRGAHTEFDPALKATYDAARAKPAPVAAQS